MLCDVGEPQKYVKKPVTNRHIVYDPIIRTVQNRQIHRERRKISGGQRLRGKRE